MILKFVFLYKKSNKDYFLKIMQNTADECDLKHYDMILNDELIFFVNGTEENLNTFSTLLSSKMPLSLYFIFKSVEVSKDMMKSYSSSLDSNTTLFDFNLEETLHIKDSKREEFCDIFTYPKSKINFTISYQDSTITSKDALKNAIFSICEKLQSGSKVALQSTKGEVLLSLDSSSYDYIMASDISNIALYTRASKDELEALATYEKPLISLNIKDVFISELGFSNALFILPYDMILYLISSVLLEQNIALVYLKKLDSAPLLLSYEAESSDEFFEIVVGNGGYFIHKNYLNFSGNVDEFIRHSFANKENIFVSYISTKHDSRLLRLPNENLIKIHFDKNPKNILNSILELKNGDKLLNNFKLEFKERYEMIEALDSTPQMTNNILDILDSASMILGFDMDKNHIFALAQSYLRDISPKIDFKNKNVDGEMVYDNLLTIRSLISFSLAGVERETLGYGICESLVDYLVLLFRDANLNYSIQDIGVVGDMLSNKIFFSKLSKKFPADLTLHFADYLDFHI